MEYPEWMFTTYQHMVEVEMGKRGYHIYPYSIYSMNENTMAAKKNGYFKNDDTFDFTKYKDDPFPGWMNDRYLLQCYFNLEEKYDCGGIPEREWAKIENYIRSSNILL